MSRTRTSKRVVAHPMTLTLIGGRWNPYPYDGYPRTRCAWKSDREEFCYGVWTIGRDGEESRPQTTTSVGTDVDTVTESIWEIE